jgi:hypothetical protein
VAVRQVGDAPDLRLAQPEQASLAQVEPVASDDEGRQGRRLDRGTRPHDREHHMWNVVLTELDAQARADFFRDVYRPLGRSLPGGVTFVRLVDGVELNDPVEIAKPRRVFELHVLH